MYQIKIMKKLFILLLFVIIEQISFGQVYQLMPQYGYEAKRMSFDSTLQIPTICGTPTLKSVYNTKRGAIAFDSCNNRFYTYNPKTATWSYLGSGGGGTSTGVNGLNGTTEIGLGGSLNEAITYIESATGAESITWGAQSPFYEYLINSQNISLLGFSAVGDTGTYKPLVIDPITHHVSNLNYYPTGSGTSIDTTGAFLISVSQPNDSTLTFQKGATQTSYTIRTSVAGSATRLITTVYNNSGSTITKGSVVYISGAHSSNLPTIALAKANAEETSAYTYGLVETDIANNASGIVIQSGNITNLNLPTSSYTDGQTLYLSPTTAGGYTTTKPLAPYHYVAIGTITRAHPNFGTIQIAIRNGFQLDEMSDVQIALVPNDSTLLQFSRVDSLWHDVSVVNAIGTKYIKPSDTATMLSKYLRKTDTTTLSNRINLKVNISDTATMLSTYQRSITAVKYSDTATMLANYQLKTPQIAYLSADFNTTNTTATNTNLTIPVEANTAYRIMIAGTASKATSSTGMRISIAAPTGTTIKALAALGSNAISTTVNSFITAVNSLGSTFAIGVGVEVPFRVEGILVTSSTAGSVTLQGATVTSNTATIYANTLMTLSKAYAQ